MRRTDVSAGGGNWNKTWKEYEYGFVLDGGDAWIGNEVLYSLLPADERNITNRRILRLEVVFILNRLFFSARKKCTNITLMNYVIL